MSRDDERSLEDNLLDAFGSAEFTDDEPERLQFILSKDSTRRLDQYLRDRLPHASRSQIQKLIDAGGVSVNGKSPKASQSMREGDVIDVILPPTPATHLEPEPIPLEILHEEPGFIVINKQDDLIVHPARSHLRGTLLNGLLHHFRESGHVVEWQGESGQVAKWPSGQVKDKGPSSDSGTRRLGHSATSAPGGEKTVSDTVFQTTGGSGGSGGPRPGVIHRLDKHTTGCIVVAKREEDQWKIARQFEKRTTLKAYLAVVHGNFDTSGGPGGVIDYPIGKHPTIREAMAVRHDSQAKDSVTLYRVREQYQGYALVELELRTGRTHQIRVHLSYLGYPIVGDILYGGEIVTPHELDHPPIAAGSRKLLNFARPKAEGQAMESRAASTPDVLMARPSLHAALLEFAHPTTHKRMRFNAPLHGPLARLITELRKHPSDGPVAKEGTHVDLDTVMPR
ncbi:MAG: hypothetical protein GC164_09825 [Phycisphaera sp.]|nr:hypothetical protein [Phycisphaera sp.]